MSFMAARSGPDQRLDNAAKPVAAAVSFVTQLYFPPGRVAFRAYASLRKAAARRCPENVRRRHAESSPMTFQYIAGAAYRALTARKDGPSLYDVCAPLLLNHRGGDAHLAKFYRTALGNPALRPLLRRTGLFELNDPPFLQRLRDALIHARDDETPDWDAIGQPVAALLDTIELRHPAPKPAPAPGRPPDLAAIESIIRTCGAHLLRSFGRNGFIPTYAAFNLIR